MSVQVSTPLPTSSDPSVVALHDARASLRIAPRSKARVRAAWIGLALLTILSVLVFWIFDALPFQDLPAHAGLIAMRHRFASSPFEQRYFVFAPHIGPYSLFRFLGECFVRVLGPVGAVRAIATLPVLATPAALLFGRWKLHGDLTPTAGFLGLTLSFGLMTLLGFASYSLGVAVMLIGLAFWLELLVDADARNSTWKRELVIAVYAAFIFVAHGHAFVLFLILAAIAALACGDRWQRILRARALVPAVLLAAYVAWIERGSTIPAGSVADPTANFSPRFQGAYDKLSLLVTPTLMTRTGIDIAIGAVLWILLVAAVIATARDRLVVDAALPSSRMTGDARKHSRALLAGALAIAAIFLALPHAIGWFGFVDGRLVPIFLFLCILAFRRPSLGSLEAAIDRAAPVLAFAMTSLVLLASYRFQSEARGYKEMMAHIPAEARLLNLPLDPNSAIFTAHPFVHYDKLVLAERPVLVSDVWFHQGSGLYPTSENPATRLPSSYSESNLQVIDWPAYRLSDWDFVLIRTRPESGPPPIPPALKLANHSGGWWLYKTD
ncbi:MAG: hypothetical protein ABI461_24240 [Polyangiaceae bacterium]